VDGFKINGWALTQDPGLLKIFKMNEFEDLGKDRHRDGVEEYQHVILIDKPALGHADFASTPTTPFTEQLSHLYSLSKA
jgi:hypothetical protein